MFVKLLILPLYLVLPFTVHWFDAQRFWYLPFALWLVGILANALVERHRARKLAR